MTETVVAFSIIAASDVINLSHGTIGVRTSDVINLSHGERGDSGSTGFAISGASSEGEYFSGTT